MPIDWIIVKTNIFATAAHAAVGQKRKYTKEDYISHPQEVALILTKIAAKPEVVAAGWLHDVVEDTNVELDLIHQEFGHRVAELVSWLTDEEVAGNRAARKAYARERWKKAPNDAKTVKLADIISNTKDVAEHDPKFAEVYLEEIRLLLPCLVGGSSTLRDIATSQLPKQESYKT